jgi:predicted glycosyltransferase
LKGNFAVLGSGIDLKRVFVEPPSKDVKIKRMAACERQLQFTTNVLDSLIDMNEDLTDKTNTANLMHFFNSVLLFKRPDYVNKVMDEYGVPGEAKLAISEFNKLTKFLQKEFDGEYGHE